MERRVERIKKQNLAVQGDCGEERVNSMAAGFM